MSTDDRAGRGPARLRGSEWRVTTAGQAGEAEAHASAHDGSQPLLAEVHVFVYNWAPGGAEVRIGGGEAGGERPSVPTIVDYVRNELLIARRLLEQ